MEPQERNQAGEPMNDQEPGRLNRMAEQTREAMGRAKEKVAAGAAGATEMSRTAVSGARDRAGRVVDFVREAESDAELKGAVSSRTEHSIDRASEALINAAPAIGRGSERAAEKVGQALHLISGPFGAILGAIAGTLGGWWKKAAQDPYELPETDEQACREHFATLAVVPSSMTYDRARSGYALGYVASRNPDYQGRPFEELEPELRRGFGDEHAEDYEALREFTRYGYGRGTGSRQ